MAKAEYGDTFLVDTGKFTGRSPKDRFIVLNPGSETAENIDWNDINQPTTSEVYDELYEKAVKHFNSRKNVYVADVYCGASKVTQKKIRFIHEMAWQQHFGKVALIGRVFLLSLLGIHIGTQFAICNLSLFSLSISYQYVHSS